jgi:alpha-tubulin suppressor-like RCC1 family protein
MKQPSGLLAAMVGSLLAVLLAPAPQIARAGADVRDVAVGYDIVCVLKINDSVWCQEGNEAWKEVEFQGTVVDIQLGNDFGCALTEVGAVWCWGDNESGQLGDGTTTESSVPRRVLGSGRSNPVRQISVGTASACAVLQTTAIRCWGRGNEGQLGDGAATSNSTWVKPYGFGRRGARNVSVGEFSTCAVKTNGALYCWGEYGMGESDTPKSVSGFKSEQSATTVAVGTRHICVIKPNNGLRCWGANDYGQLGNRTTTTSESSVPVYGFSTGGVRSVTVGSHDTCAVKRNQSVWCWGRFDFTAGGVADYPILQPVSVPGLRGASSTSKIDSLYFRTCLVKLNQTVVCMRGGGSTDGLPTLLETP